MSTRSRIGVMHGDIFKHVYCHFDGYPSGVGAILLEHYDSVKANQLIALGDLSSLGPNIGIQHEFDCPHAYGTDEYQVWYEARKKVCTFYGRDRGEVGGEYQVASNFDEFLGQAKDSWADYFYIMRDGCWFVGSADQPDLQPLHQVLEQELV